MEDSLNTAKIKTTDIIVMITYEVEDFADDARSAKVTYTDDQGFTHERQLNIPRNLDGSIDEEYWAEIQEGQLLGVNNKVSLGVIQFTDPNEIHLDDEM